MASPGNRHRANCIGTLSFPVPFRAMGSGGGICAAPLLALFCTCIFNCAPDPFRDF